MERSKKYASYTDDEIIKLSSANLPLRSKSYLELELEIRGLKQVLKEKNLAEVKAKRSYKTYLVFAVLALGLAVRTLQRYL